MAGPARYDPAVQKQRVGSPVPVYEAIASGDKGAAMDLYNISTRGSSRPGTGPFSRFFEQFMAPIVLAAMNAQSGGMDYTDPDNPKPRNMDFDVGQLMAQLQQGVTGEMPLFDFLGGIGNRAMSDFLGSGGGDSYEQMRNMALSLSPLMSAGLSPIYAQDYGRQQANTFADMYDKAVADPKFGDQLTDWDDFFADSPFYQQYYGGKGAVAPPRVPGASTRKPSVTDNNYLR